jgi:acetyl-CoA carboxylase biotin carboxyl carrier protein
VDFSELKELISILENSKLKRLVFKKGDFEVELEKDYLKSSSSVVHDTDTGHIVLRGEEKEVIETIHSYIVSPMVGTFYLSSAPNQPTFVKVNDSVREDTVVCIIEAMKVMNEVKAGKTGVIKEVLVENGHPVEFGTKLFRIE